jgi:hypothetical protein
MFVRFRQTPHRLQLSLVETRREGGKVRHEHIASLGAIITPLTVADRVAFWTSLHQRLDRLSNRLDGEGQAKILAAVHARVPMPTVDETRQLQLDVAKQHETVWRIYHVRTEGIVEENKARLKAAQRMVAEGEPLVAVAAEEVAAAEERRERIERGENVSLPGKPPSLKELGITEAHAEHAMAVSALTPKQFERYLDFGQRQSDYANRDYCAGIFRVRDQPVDRPPFDLIGRPRPLISDADSRASLPGGEYPGVARNQAAVLAYQHRRRPAPFLDACR